MTVEEVPWEVHEVWVNSLTKGDLVRKLHGATYPPEERSVTNVMFVFQRELEADMVKTLYRSVRRRRNFLVLNPRTQRHYTFTIGMLYPATTYKAEMPQEETSCDAAT